MACAPKVILRWYCTYLYERALMRGQQCDGYHVGVLSFSAGNPNHFWTSLYTYYTVSHFTQNSGEHMAHRALNVCP